MRFKIQSTETPGGTLASISAKLTKLTPLHAVLGKRVEIELRDHFAQRGGADFWNQIRSATAYEGADETGARVVVSDVRLNQKVFGGKITPKEGKFLTIPAIAEAKGKPARSFDFLIVRRFHSGALALVEADRTNITYGKTKKDGTRTRKAERGQRGRVWYWLARSVTQKKDPDALPSEQKMAGALAQEADDFMARRGGN